MKSSESFDLLLSVPPNMCSHLAECEPHIAENCFATFDPPGHPLGSGGGTAYVLEQAWQAVEGKTDFTDWLAESGKLIIHGGGQSRRLPAYAATGKLFMPIQVYRWALGQKLDQTLLDLNLPVFNRISAAASESSRVMIASGDMIIRSDGELPPLPDADIVFFGLWAKPEDARNFGVMFCDRAAPEKLVTFLQKPSPDEIRERSKKQMFMIDIGVWLLSERAVNCLMKKCGWDAATQKFGDGEPDEYDLYGRWALHLGSCPVEADEEISSLTTAGVTLPQGGFYHFGTNGDMTQSLYELQNLVADQTKLGAVPTLAQPRQFIQNAVFQAPLRREENHSLWVENSFIPASWKIASRNILTGIPENDWVLELEDGVCLDLVPVDETVLCIRPYGYTDAFRGSIDDSKTQWLNRSLVDWFAARGISPADAGIDPKMDIQTAPLFPVPEKIDPAFIRWMFAAEPEESDEWRSLWLKSLRLSARELGQQVNLSRLYAQRNKLRETALPVMARNREQSVFSFGIQ